MDRYRFILLMTLIIMLSIFGSVIALGKVEEKTSYGLDRIVFALGMVASGLASGGNGKEDKKGDVNPPPPTSHE